ncbi:hypothetical protein [Nannocystis pusilla]|uniref:hypothetical protein n=1 Tax=Nannocystis pusilla TaxID=889268 RepID=UPI003B7B0B68
MVRQISSAEIRLKAVATNFQHYNPLSLGRPLICGRPGFCRRSSRQQSSAGS